ncbi:MAG: hypothetical protein M1817_001402 [Caeruleum heppii]|nr:MAG: hypothetical protein M1817_001402 [Caeruleum heppii]
MLQSVVLLCAVSVLFKGLHALPSGPPVCASTCWENTKYVSYCEDELQCLCDDQEYQNAVFQCLYSQCMTAQFAPGLHHALAKCLDNDSEDQQQLSPRLIRRSRVRKRQEELLEYPPPTISGTPVFAGSRQSAVASAQPARSANPSGVPRRRARRAPADAVPSEEQSSLTDRPDELSLAVPTHVP